MAVDFGDARVKRGAAQQNLAFSAADARRLARRYKAGVTLNALAAEFGCGRTTINRRLRAMGIEARRVRPTDDEVDQMVALYEAGRSLAHVGNVLGFDPTSVMKYLRRRGVALRDSHGRIRVKLALP